MRVPSGLVQGPATSAPRETTSVAPTLGASGRGVVWMRAQRPPSQCSSGAQTRQSTGGVAANEAGSVSCQTVSLSESGVPGDSRVTRSWLRQTATCQPTRLVSPRPEFSCDSGVTVIPGRWVVPVQ